MATYKVKEDGKAQAGLSAGDQVVTAGGTYKITGVNADGSYKSEKVSNTTTSNYTGTYANSGSSGSSGSSSKKSSGAPSGFSGSATGVNTYTSDQDAIKAQMNANSQAWWNASEEEQERLHAANEALARLLNENDGTVGYDSASGTWSGSAGQAVQQVPTSGFSYESAPSYTNRYDEQINDLAEEILNRDPFSYNYAEDPLYQYYANMYQRNGDRAMRDTLGEMAARTGGLGSSYAGSVSQQTYNNYMQGLNDVIPELYNLAYSMYQDEGNTERANLEMLQALESGDYTKYLNLLNQYNTDRSFDYGVYSDDRAYDYQTLRDAISDAQWQQNYNLSAQKASANTGKSGVIDTVEPEDEDTGGNLFTLADEYAQKGGDPEDYIKLYWKDYGYSSQTAALSGYKVYQTENGYNAEQDIGYNSAYFTAAMNSLGTMLAQGNAEGAISGIDSFWSKLSTAQRQQVQELLARYGYSYEED